MNIIIFEDEFYDNLSPLTLLKPTYDIRTGIFTNAERVGLVLKEKFKIFYHCRKILSDYITEIKGNKTNNFEKNDSLFLNGRIVFKKNLLDYLINFNDSFIWKYDNIVLAVKLSNENIRDIYPLIKPDNKCEFIPFSEIVNQLKLNILDNETFKFYPEKDFYIINYSWDIIKYFNSILNYDLELLEFKLNNKNQTDCKIVNPELVNISHSSIVMPYTVFDASNGKIFIDDEVLIEPFTYIKGPVYIGKKSIIKAGTKLYGPVSIGYNSRIAGEVSGTLFHSFVNKQHDGFIGNSYISEFVNLGADTVTSNLKNNYSLIKARFNKNSIQHQTGLTFLGSIIGDHTKTGINTMLNTGSIIGIFALIAGGGFPDKFIDSFTWYIQGKQPSRYKIDEALQTAKIVTERRQVDLSQSYEKLIRNVYDRIVNT